VESFGARLKKLRLEKDMTQEQLGKIFNVTNVGIAKWESNDRFPDKVTLVNIAEYFHVTIDYLLGRTDSPSGNGVNSDTTANINDEAYVDEQTAEQIIDQALLLLKAKCDKEGKPFNPFDIITAVTNSLKKIEEIKKE
jgi:transcriptional regulator with XRE-family HTH domain